MKRTLPLALLAATGLLVTTATAQTAPAKTTPAKTSPAKTPEKTTSGKSAPADKTEPARRTSTTDRVISDVEQDLGVFRDWINTKLDQADVVTKRELPRIKEEYKTQSERIDRGLDSLTATGKREYAGLKNRFETWEARQERLEKQANKPETIQETQDRMLGENVNMATARGSEMTDLYGRFMDYVRANRRNWEAEDWAQASAVLARLNQRYDKVRDDIEMDDRIRIRTWQGEYRTLEQAKKTKEVLDKGQAD